MGKSSYQLFILIRKYTITLKFWCILYTAFLLALHQTSDPHCATNGCFCSVLEFGGVRLPTLSCFKEVLIRAFDIFSWLDSERNITEEMLSAYHVLSITSLRMILALVSARCKDSPFDSLFCFSCLSNP